jgi:hypothetical protein
MPDKHQAETTDDRIKCLISQIQLFGIHNLRGYIGESPLFGEACSLSEHFCRNIGRQHCPYWSDFLCRKQTLVARSSSNIENAVSRSQFCRF